MQQHHATDHDNSSHAVKQRALKRGLTLRSLTQSIACLMCWSLMQGALGAPPLQPLPLKKQGNFYRIEQQRKQAKKIRQNLTHISLPAGFEISLYALVPDARHIAVADEHTLFVGTRRTTVWAVHDRDADGHADLVQNFAPRVRFSLPNGVCFGKAGELYVAELNRLLVFPKAAANFERRDIQPLQVLPQGELIPKQLESRNHGARVCVLGPDNKLYVSLGQPHNVAPKEKLAIYNHWGIGGIIRLNLDGTERETYSFGIRNSVGHAFHPTTGELWFTDNQVDWMGDDIPPGEINRQSAPGQNFGFPWYGGGSVRTREYRNESPPKNTVLPVRETVAHAADLGMMFYTGQAFPKQYRGGIFSAQHGSWNRSTPVGARVMFTPVDADGQVTGETIPFAEGWLRNGSYSGRPVDVQQLPDGSLVVSDDFAGALYRIVYHAP